VGRICQQPRAYAPPAGKTAAAAAAAAVGGIEDSDHVVVVDVVGLADTAGQTRAVPAAARAVIHV
jgi:hypothetical protein